MKSPATSDARTAAAGDEIVSAAVLGDWLACSDKTIRDLAHRGVLTRSGRGQYNLKASVRAYAEHMRRVVVQRGEGTPAAAKGRLAAAQAEVAELKAAQIRGEVVPTELVSAEWSKIVLQTRAALLAVPSRLQQTAPHLTRSDIDALDREIRDALTALADDKAAHGERAADVKTATLPATH